MITIKKAPAGLIAQLYTDDKRLRNVVTGEPVLRSWLGVTGHWSETKEEALRTMEVDRLQKVKKTQKKIEKLREDIADLEAHIIDLNTSSQDNIEYE
jgi:hypothetical protein